jgi:hypothetical protein
MKIQSAFNTGLEGFQHASNKASQAAASIAAQTLTIPSDYQLDQAHNSVAGEQWQKVDHPVGINQSIVDLKVAEFQAKASIKFIKTADEILGTLLDVSV